MSLRTASLSIALTVLLAACARAPESSQPAAPAASQAPAAAGAAPTSGPGWTGLTSPTDVIAARDALMKEIEQLMIPLDSYTAGDKFNPDVLRANAAGVARLLKIVPHLFPPTTNLYEKDSKTPATLALPRLWQNFDAFTIMAQNAQKVADQAASTQDPVTLKQKALDIRAACAACHDAFLLTYKPEAASQKDASFDFGNFK